MAYIALYRKWRPHTFRDLVGQDHISRTLSQAITSGRIGHAYLFSGPRGTGKTSTAKILAMALNCKEGPTPDPCGKCESCQRIMDGSSMDVFEIDAASNRGIDEIRGLRETVKFAPAEGRYKVYIIDEVHMLTAEAFNALLKTLEEPPAHVVFILATTEAHKVPPTIQSRCQRFDFRRITASEIQGRLRYICDEMKTEADDKALELIALQADGGLRDALSILDQCISLSDGRVTEAQVQEMLGLVGHSWIYRMTEALAAGKAQDVLNLVAELLRDGKDLRQIVAELELHLRSLMIYQAAGTVEGLDLYAEPEDVLKKQSAFWKDETIMQMLARLHETTQELRWSPQPRITVEIALLALCRGELGGVAFGGGVSSAKPAVPERDAANGPVADARFSQLEAKIAQLAAQLAARPAAPPAGASTSAAAASAPSSNASSVPAAPKIAPSMPRPASSAGTPAPNVAISEDDQLLWQKVVQTFRDQSRMSTVACLQQAAFSGFSGGRCYLTFPTDMLAQLTMRIYRTQVEQVLAGLFGHEMQLVCTAAAVPPPPPAPPKPAKPEKPPLPYEEHPADVDMDALPPEQQKNLQNAIDILGGDIIEPPPPISDADAPPPPEEE
ncbi:MAG: DNA polymerase III subunit gamma/tau [Selenomonas sp.]|uniref:DNA polymerase III subunit gamma/tau n=1 Tax=Selenomonas sp. TaxID=2053611 RepID=UPI0025FA262C|nr:DNA polymerase III subunit gamma/tau [Selenomonas sp.]MCI6233112.1 DNA polymerase III subunit gamma/tau [Selenomonas sp.]